MQHSDFHDYVINDLLSEIPGITSRKMFGGYGIYKDGIIFALIAYDILYFKVDETNKVDYERRGSTIFTYAKGNHPPISMSYWELPPEIMDNTDMLKTWVEKSVQVSIAAKKAKKK